MASDPPPPAGDDAGNGIEPGTERDENDLRSRGNTLFESGRYDEAVEHYGRALERAREANSVEDLVKILNNRSAAHAKLGAWEASLVDAEWASELDGTCVRAHYRRGVALLELGMPEESLEALEAGLALSPGSARLAGLVRRAQGLVREAFRLSRSGEVRAHRAEFAGRMEARLAAERLRDEAHEEERRRRRLDSERRRILAEEQFLELQFLARQQQQQETASENGEAEKAHEVLGVGPRASTAEVRQAYLRLLTRCHPDKKGGSREAYDRVRKAYQSMMMTMRGGDGGGP